MKGKGKAMKKNIVEAETTDKEMSGDELEG